MRLSIVMPFWNEAESVRPLFARLRPVLDGLGLESEIVCVDDGSTDGTLPALLAEQAEDPRIAVVALSRNFGKEAALTSGLDHARGEAVMVMDGDLQHPPELIPEFLARLNEGYDVVYGVQTTRRADGPLRAGFSRLFYRLLSRSAETPIPPNAGDFRLMSGRVVSALRTLGERKRFMKGLYAWVGFRQAALPYEAEPRPFGASSFSPLRLVSFGWDGLLSFTAAPLRASSFLGLLIATVSAGYAAWIVLDTLLLGNDVPGYPTIVTAIFFLGGVQLLSIGILGEYVARIFNETKQRPIYLVRDVYRPD